MSDILTAIPNVSAPDLPCEIGLTAINQGDSTWHCVAGPVACPAGTQLYVGKVLTFEWKFCTPDIPYAEAHFGPNLAPSVTPSAVPALDLWASVLVVSLLSYAGMRWLR
jgi:hypothetical protein